MSANKPMWSSSPIAKNSRETVVASLSQFAGRNLIDVRIYAPFAGPANQLAPTSKGVNLAAEKIGELIEALTAAKAQAEALGWIGGGE